MNRKQKDEMTISECIYTRRTIRQFESKKLEADIIQQLIEAAVQAPSACNFQAWKFIVIDDDDVKNSIVNAGGSKIIQTAPQGVFVVYRNDILVTGRKHGDYIQSASAAIMNLLLTAHDKKLGACWICDLPKQKTLRKILELPHNFSVIAYIALGYPLKKQKNTDAQIKYHYGDSDSYNQHKRKYSYEQIICYNQFKTVKGDCNFAKLPKNSLKNRILSLTLAKRVISLIKGR